MIIQHLAIENEWEGLGVVENPKTLILGSFNPFNPNRNNTDYYYGRNTNYFWKIIAIHLLKPENYFFIESDGLTPFKKKIAIMNKYKFCFYDVVDILTLTSNNEMILNQYINEKIHIGFDDSKLFVTNTKFNGVNIKIERGYNKRIINLLEQGTIKKVIQTMGKNRIKENLKAYPVRDGFHNYIKEITNICSKKDICFIPNSYSPSQIAVHKLGEQNRGELDNWLIQNIFH